MAVAHNTRDPFDTYRLARYAALQMLAGGHTTGHFKINSPALLQRIQRHFRIDPRPCAWNPATGHPVQWTIAVDLQDAIEQTNLYA